MKLTWSQLAAIAAACSAGDKFQYRLSDELEWRDACVQTPEGLFTLSNHSLRIRPESELLPNQLEVATAEEIPL